MAKKTPLQKEAILREINKIPVKSLIGLIKNGDFNLDKYIEHDLDSNKVEEIKKELKIIEGGLDKKELAKKIYKKINDDKMIVQHIQRHLLNNDVTEEGLIENCDQIDENILEKIKRYEGPSISSENNKDPLQFGTDIFFYGKSSSGKTCVLASIFSYANKKGILIDNYKASIQGHKYKDIIVKELENGILPRRTNATIDAVTYISTTLKVNDNDHPLNFVEMSGEFFSDAALEFDGLDGSIDAHGYLSSKNKKIFFFVIDYQMHKDGELGKGKTQEQEFNAILSLLDDYENALDNTHCIYIIINKSDKFPSDCGDKNEFAKKYFIKNFASVNTNLQDKKARRKHKLDPKNPWLRVQHYSIGDFIFNNSYLINQNDECPQRIINSISKHTDKDRKDGFLDKLFGND